MSAHKLLVILGIATAISFGYAYSASWIPKPPPPKLAKPPFNEVRTTDEIRVDEEGREKIPGLRWLDEHSWVIVLLDVQRDEDGAPWFICGTRPIRDESRMLRRGHAKVYLAPSKQLADARLK